MSILRPSKEAILDDLRSFVLNEAEERTGFLATAVSKLNVVRRVQQGQKLSFNEPYLALILQGKKKTYIADKSFTYTAGDIVVTNLPFLTPEQQDGGIEPPPVLASRFFRFLNLP